MSELSFDSGRYILSRVNERFTLPSNLGRRSEAAAWDAATAVASADFDALIREQFGVAT